MKNDTLYVGYGKCGGIAAMQVKALKGHNCPLNIEEWLPIIFGKFEKAQAACEDVVILRSPGDLSEVVSEWIDQGIRHCVLEVEDDNLERDLCVYDLATGEEIGTAE